MHDLTVHPFFYCVCVCVWGGGGIKYNSIMQSSLVCCDFTGVVCFQGGRGPPGVPGIPGRKGPRVSINIQKWNSYFRTSMNKGHFQL